MSEYEGGICCAAALQAEGSAGWEQAQINRIADLESELTRLRAALAEIAALQTEEPTARPNTDAGFFEAFDAGEAHGVKVGHFEAGNIARGAMKHSSSEEAK